MSDGKPIIVIKKKGGHGGHHGGAWKVAYADFVTAMMAFFMVMWLVNSADTVTKKNIASYFKKPGLFEQGSGTPLMIGEAGILEDAYVPTKKLKKGSSGGRVESDDDKKIQKVEPPKAEPIEQQKTEQEIKDKQKKEEEEQKKKEQQALNLAGLAGTNKDKKALGGMVDEKAQLEKLAEQIKQMIKQAPELQELLGIVDVKLENDGLNIEIMDTEKTSMFELGQAAVLPEAQTAFAQLARLLSKVPNKIDIVGHTDAKPFGSGKDSYSNWELSSDRANTARRVLESAGMPSDHIRSVVGRADRQLRTPKDPFAASNRRITLKMRFESTRQFEDTISDNLLKDSANPNGRGNNSQDTLDPEKPRDLSVLNDPNLKPLEEKPEKDVAHSYSPKQIIRAVNKKNQNRILLGEDEANETRDPALSPPASPIKKEKIFKESPVIGSSLDPFDGL